jgi:hypothetical protein
LHSAARAKKKNTRAMMHECEKKWVAGGVVRKTIILKGEFCEEARIAARKRLILKEAIFAARDFADRDRVFARGWEAQRRAAAAVGRLAICVSRGGRNEVTPHITTI